MVLLIDPDGDFSCRKLISTPLGLIDYLQQNKLTQFYRCQADDWNINADLLSYFNKEKLSQFP